MQEKVKILSVTPKGKVLSVKLEDDRELIAFDKKFNDLVGKEIDAFIAEGKEYPPGSGKKDMVINLAREKKKFPINDHNFDRKKASLELAIQAIDKMEEFATPDKVIELAEKFNEYLK